MTTRSTVLALAALLGASLLANAWLLLRRSTASSLAGDDGPRPATASSQPAAAAAPVAQETAASFAALVDSLGAARRAAQPRAPQPPTGGARRALVDGFSEGRVTRALLDDIQCRIARDKAAEAWRRDAAGIRAALLSDDTPSPALRAATLAGKRAELADVLGVDGDDARIAELAEQLEAFNDEAGAEVRRLVALDPPDWRAALDVVRGLYRQQDAAVLHGYGPAGADDWRMNEVDERAAILAIGASLVGVPWSSIDDRTPPALAQ